MFVHGIRLSITKGYGVMKVKQQRQNPFDLLQYLFSILFISEPFRYCQNQPPQSTKIASFQKNGKGKISQVSLSVCHSSQCAHKRKRSYDKTFSFS